MLSEQIQQRFGIDLTNALQTIDLIKGASPAFEQKEFLAGKQTPVFFGSAINNFGVKEILDAPFEMPGANAHKRDAISVS